MTTKKKRGLTVDSTASEKEIVDDLEIRNKQAFTYYNHVTRQRRNFVRLWSFHCEVPSHPLNTFAEDWNGKVDIDYFEPFPYKSLPPKMIMPMRHMGKSDPVAEYIHSKMEWQRMCRVFAGSIKRYNHKKRYKKMNEDVVRCSKLVVDAAAHYDSDPDPYFDCTYNWYYAGNGNLQYVCINFIDYLLHSNFNCVYLSRFNKSEMIIDFENAIVFECDENENILECICSTLNIVILRTKYRIYVLKILESEDQLKFEKIMGSQSELPYTSISLDNHHKNIVYITTLDNKLSILNLDREKARSVKLKGNKSLVNNWHTVTGAGRECYLHVTKSCISQYDKRTNNIVNEYTNIKNVTDDEDCYEISVAKHFEGSNYVYFSTDHNLFLMDLRFQKTWKPRVIRRWPHGMECAPTYISNCYIEFNRNLISLSSQWCEDMCVVPSYNYQIKEPANGGVSIPYRPPSILNAFKQANLKLQCFDLYNPLKYRLPTAIVGNLIMEQGDKFIVLMLNSLGDISCHTLFPEHLDTFIEDDTTESLQAWSSNYKLDKKIYEVSCVKNIAGILKQLKKVSSDYTVEGSWLKDITTKYNEQEVIDAFENEELDAGLQEAWTGDINETMNVESSTAEQGELHLHYSDEDDS